jgi:hypothetical protein
MMKRKLMKSGAGVAALAMLMGSIPALAGQTDKIEASCFDQAEQVTPPLREPEKEAFIANCKANATADTPPAKQDPKY